MKYKIIVCLSLIFTASCMISCDNWLDVSPRTEVLKEKTFKEQGGFKDALIGVYIKLSSSSLYGHELSFGNIERLAQHWEEGSNSEWLKYNYVDNTIRITFEYWYRTLYSVIADANNILKEIDDKKDIFEPGWYELIKGELLGIRAYCHLDILRLWGPIPGTPTAGNILPYVKTVSIIPHQHITYIKYIEELEKDLNEAQNLMEEWDPLISNQMKEYGEIHDFWKKRQIRMNVNAIKALKARFYLWTQNKSLANQYAKEVIESTNTSENLIYALADGGRMNTTDLDYSRTSEHIFAIYQENLYQIGEKYFKGENYIKNRDLVGQLFDGGVGTFDNRFVNLWKTYTVNAVTKHTIIKYHQFEDATKANLQIPLLRLAEMYLIAIETENSFDDASEILATFYQTRGLPAVTISTDTGLKDLMAKEYNREFYAEGQGFYVYKRLNYKDILWSAYEGGPDIYILPMPDTEILN